MAINKRFASEEYVNENYAPISHPHSWAEVGEKTVMGDTLTWNGNTEGLYSVMDMFYQVSDIVPTLEDFQNGGTLVTHGGEVLEFTSENVLDAESMETGSNLIMIETDAMGIFIALKDGASLTAEDTTVIFEKTGIYYPHYGEIYCVSLTINGYNGFPTTGIDYLDPKYIKDMYYEEQNVTSIEGIEYIVCPEFVDNGNNYQHDYIPLEVGQIYNVYRNNSVLYGACEVKIDENGDCYIGTSDYSEHPFYITPTVTYVRSSWVNTVGAINLKIVGVSGNITENEIHHIDPKYIKDMYYEYIAPNNDYVCGTAISTEYDNTWVNNDTLFIEDFLVKDATYEVNWDGQTYTCVARQNSYGEIYIGNQALALEDGWDGFLETVESNEPFFFYTYMDNYDEDYGLLVQTAGEHTISVNGVGEKMTPYKIDIKYIPTEFFNSKIDEVYWQVDYKMDNYNPTGRGSFSMNRKSDTTIGDCSHAEGYDTTASGDWSHAEGYETTASGDGSHAEGYKTTASGDWSHAEGSGSTITLSLTGGANSTSYKVSSNNSDIKIGRVLNYNDTYVKITDYDSSTLTITTDKTLSSTALSNTIVDLVLGIASGEASHAEGNNTTASNTGAHAEGWNTTASGIYGSHAEGYFTTASGTNSHAEGSYTTASGHDSHAEGSDTTASGIHSHAEGGYTKASNYSAHAEGSNTEASGMYSHAEGLHSQASGEGSHAEGYNTKATTTNDGVSTTTSTKKGYYTHAEGYGTVAYGAISHAEGNGTKASGDYSHAEGRTTLASGAESHAEGYDTTASGKISHAEGYQTIASGEYQHVQGKYNAECPSYYIIRKFTIDNFMLDTKIWVYDSVELNYETGEINEINPVYCDVRDGNISNFIGNYFSYDHDNIQGVAKIVAVGTKNGSNIYHRPFCDIEVYHRHEVTTAHIVGNGESDTKRSNAHTLDWAGNAWFAGDVYVGSTSGTNMDEGSKKLVTEDAIDFDEIEILAEAGVADPVTDENGQVLTDANNIIYIF